MPPKHSGIKSNNGVLYVDIRLDQTWHRKHARKLYRPRYRRKKQLLEVWHRVVRKNPLAFFDWLITRGWGNTKEALGDERNH